MLVFKLNGYKASTALPRSMALAPSDEVRDEAVRRSFYEAVMQAVREHRDFNAIQYVREVVAVGESS